MRHYKYVPLTIPKGQQDSNDVAVNPMTMAHMIYAPENVSGHATVQCQTWGTGWCDLDDALVSAESCLALPLLACSSLRVQSSTVSDEDRQFIYAYLYQEN